MSRPGDSRQREQHMPRHQSGQCVWRGLRGRINMDTSVELVVWTQGFHL